MARHPGGRPRRNTPEQVDTAIDSMIAEYEESGDIKLLDDTELMQRLKISPGTLERYYQGSADKALDNADIDTAEAEGNGIDNNINNNSYTREYSTKERYAEALKKLIAYRRRVCISHLTQDRFNTGWIFLSKQPHWGGFQDVQRTESSGRQEIKVCISGPDGRPLKE